MFPIVVRWQTTLVGYLGVCLNVFRGVFGGSAVHVPMKSASCANAALFIGQRSALRF